jgi:predicted RNase H-like nuclease (RuvC/YqgF family)
MEAIDEDKADADERHEGERIVAARRVVQEDAQQEQQEKQEQQEQVDECADTQELQRLKQEVARLQLHNSRLQAELSGQPGADQ